MPTAKKNVKYKYDLVADEILQGIAAGKYNPGDKLPSESELTVLYDVSRVTLRESLKKLSMMGVVTIAQGDGTYVKEICPSTFMKPLLPMMAYAKSNVEEIYDARIFIEGGASELAAKRRTPEDILTLQRLIDGMDEAILRMDKEQFSHYDKQFHNQIEKISRNGVLQMIYELFDQVMTGYIGRINTSRPVLKSAMLDHRQLFRAIADQRAELARITMREHLRKSKDILVKKLAGETGTELDEMF